MQPSDEIRKLAIELVDRKEGGDPLMLFVGSGCARAAKVPSSFEIAARVFAELHQRDPDRASSYLPMHVWKAYQDDPEAGKEELIESFYRLMGSLSPIARFSMLQRYYSKVAVPAFYQDLAWLVKDGHFKHILTTNVDTLLEESLAGVGLRAGGDFEILTLGKDDQYKQSMRKISRPDHETFSIIKLHGDLAKRELLLTPEEIEDALHSQRSFVKAELRQSMVLVGYELGESEPVDRWLTWGDAELWWVQPERPDQGHFDRGNREVLYLDGPTADPRVFFGALRTMISAIETEPLPEIELDLEEPLEEQEWASFSTESRGLDDYSSEKLQAQYLADQLRNSRALITRLQSQRLVKAEPSLDVQIDYQKRQITQLEDALRELALDKTEVLSVLHQVLEKVEGELDPSVVRYLQEQVGAIEREFAGEEPNAHVVATAIGAIVLLADRLGAQVINPELVRQLSTLAPGSVRAL